VTNPRTVRQSDFLQSEILADPYPFYARLRDHQVVEPDDAGVGQRLFRYDDIITVLRDRRFSVARVVPALDRLCFAGANEEVRTPLREAVGVMRVMLLYTDPPQHCRLRAILQPFFAPGVVSALRPRIEQIVALLLNDARRAGRMDLIADLACRLPMLVIAELIGLPPADREQFTVWSSALSGFIGSGRPDPAKIEAARRSQEDFADYLAPLLASRSQQPRPDLLTALVTAESRGELTSSELLATCITLLIAGHETTAGLIGNGLLALLRHPVQLAMLRSDPSLIDSAVEELARFDSPVQLTTLVAAEDLWIGQRFFRHGTVVECWIGAANRDPAQFADPDRLELRRTPNQHLAYGRGRHYCLGTALGRLEAKVAINAVVQTFPRLWISEEPISWRRSVVFRRPETLHVEFS
jgi:cytochrome P450